MRGGRIPVAASNITWLTPALAIWQEVVGNPPSRAGRLAQALAPLRKDGHIPAEVLAALRAYLQGHKRTNFAFLNLPKFADTYTAWIPKPSSRYVPPVRKVVPLPEPTMTAAQMAAEITKLKQAHPGSAYIQVLERMYARKVGA